MCVIDDNGNRVKNFEENDVVMTTVCYQYREDGESDKLMSRNSVTEQCVKGAEGKYTHTYSKNCT